MPQKCDEPLEHSCPTNAPIGAFAHLDSGLGGTRAAKCHCGGRRPHDPAHSKWGRHCCRPHSHRRVDGPSAHDASGEPLASLALGAMLGARCLASRCLRLATGVPEICHRRSRRHPAFARVCICVLHPAEAIRVSPARLCCCRGFRPFTFRQLLRLWACAVPLLLPSGQVLGLSSVTASP